MRFQIWVRPDCGAARVGYNYIKIHFRYGLCGSVLEGDIDIDLMVVDIALEKHVLVK